MWRGLTAAVRRWGRGVAGRQAWRNRAVGVRALNMTALIESADQWRDRYNPLSGLDIAKAVSLRGYFMRGLMADIQWTYDFIERSDADLMALVQRRLAALLKLDWNIKVVSEEEVAGFSQALADDQAAYLRGAYEGIDNLYEAIEHLAMATFRGFAHVEKHRGKNGTKGTNGTDGKDAGAVTHLEVCDQWNVVRDGYRGKWKVNPEAYNTDFASLPAEYEIPEENWIVRTVTRHIDWIGLVKFIRGNLCEKDWDAFCEVYDLPASVIIGPPNIDPDTEDDYKESATRIAKGGSGYLPNGSSVLWAEGPRGVTPFLPRLQWLREQLVLAGTGGLLTMLTAPTGIGKGPSEEHADVFEDIAKGEAREISECFQGQFDKGLLEGRWPGKPVLAYFELAAQEETDTSEVIADAVQLKQAGFAMDAEELSERTGYKLEARAEVMAGWMGMAGKKGTDGTDGKNGTNGKNGEEGEEEGEEIKNRVAAVLRNQLGPQAGAGEMIPGARRAVVDALLEDLQPLIDRLENIQSITDAGELQRQLKEFAAAMPGYIEGLQRESALARALEPALIRSVILGAMGVPGAQVAGRTEVMK